MKRTSLILTAVFGVVMLPAAFAQSTPSQSQDPNMPSATPSEQTPTAQQPSQTPNNGDPAAKASAPSSEAQRSFTGSIVKTGDKFVLHSSGTDYQLDDQAQAKKFKDKDVKVTGQLDQSSNMIRVQSIEASSSM